MDSYQIYINNCETFVCLPGVAGQTIYWRATKSISIIVKSLFVCLLLRAKTAGEEARRQLHKNAASNLEQVLAATPHKTPTVRPPASFHENYPS